MARKHAKQKGGIKQAVNHTLIEPEKTERAIKLNPTTGEYEVVVTTIPAVYKQGRAYGSTTKHGKPNVGGQKESKK